MYLIAKQFFLFFLFSLFLFSGCNSQRIKKDFLIGEYENSTGRWSPLKKKSYTVGSILKLKMDSTYFYSTCGNIMEGSWKVINDSLFLYCKKNRYRIDSLNSAGFRGKFATCSNLPSIFVINKKNIENSWIGNDGIEYIERFVRVEDIK